MNNIMNWPIDKNWKCEVCGEKHSESLNLEWQLANGTCMCSTCGAFYTMWDTSTGKNIRVTVPILMLKDEYVKPAKKLWAEKHINLNKVTNKLWKEYGVI